MRKSSLDIGLDVKDLLPYLEATGLGALAGSVLLASLAAAKGSEKKKIMRDLLLGGLLGGGLGATGMAGYQYWPEITGLAGRGIGKVKGLFGRGAEPKAAPEAVPKAAPKVAPEVKSLNTLVPKSELDRLVESNAYRIADLISRGSATVSEASRRGIERFVDELSKLISSKTKRKGWHVKE